MGVLMSRVGIVGAGWYGFKPTTIDISFQDMMFESSARAYSSAKIDPRYDVDAFVDCQEDMWEGIAISDEFAPEPIGGALRPTFTVAGDGLEGIAHAYMLIKTGHFNVVSVESHGKPSEIKTLQDIYRFALDPLHVRPLDYVNPLFYAGLDAVAYMKRTGAKREHLAMVAVKNKNNGLSNERASFSTKLDLDYVLSSNYSIYPMTNYEIAPFSDASITFVLANEEYAKKLTDNPVWIDGIGYSTETGTGATEWHEWGKMKSFRNAAIMAYKLANLNGNPQVDFAEVEDRFSFMELLALEETMLVKEGEAHKMLEKGDFNRDGYLPINPSGGSLSMGIQLEATGLSRLLEAYLQLTGKAGNHQLKNVRRGLVASWRGVPTYTSMVALLSV